MTKKHFIALADEIRMAEKQGVSFSYEQLGILADFCKAQNPMFNRDRWLTYIDGGCGPNGGKVKAA